MRKKLFAILMSAMMMVSFMPSMAFANGEDYVAQIGDNGYATLEAAVEAAEEGQTVEIIKADIYRVPSISKNIIIKGAINGVVFNCEGAAGSSIASIPNGATFENVTMNFGLTGYHGFQHAGTINMKNCTLNGLFFSYGDMTFDTCTFNQNASEYSMWCYAGNITYKNCTVNCAGKFANVYNEGNDDGTPWTVTATGCTFNSSKTNKGAFNVKESCGNKALKYEVTVSDCTCNEYFPTASTSETLVVIDPLVQVDDRKTGFNGITVNLNGKQVYPQVETKKLPVAEVITYDLTNEEDLAKLATVVGEDGFPICDFSNGVSLSGSDLYTLQVPDCAYKFAAIEEAGASDYGDWYADYTVSFDKPVAKDSMGLVGYYGSWGIGLGFLAPMAVPANVEVPLLNTMMSDSNWTYDQIIQRVGEFYCGAFNLSAANNDTTMTVKLRIFDPEVFNNPGNIQNPELFKESENTFTIEEIQYKLTKNGAIPVEAVNYTVVGTADSEIDIPAGKFYLDNGAMVKAENDVPVTQKTAYFTDGKSIVVVDDDKNATVTTKQTSSIGEQDVPEEVKAAIESVKTNIETSTSVSGVELTTEGENSGVQAIVNEALKNTEKAEAIKAADELEVKVDVVVTPKAYTAESTLKFDLTPVATLVAKNASGEETAKVEGIEVTNEMINQTQNITVNVFSDFEPKTVLHVADNGETTSYTKGQTPSGSTFTYDATAKKVTLIVHHFSDVMLFSEDYVAMIGDKGYETLTQAIAEVGEDETIKVLKDIPDAVGISVPSGKKFTIDFQSHKYSIGIPGAGSTGTTTQGFQLLKGSDITFKNGTIECTAANADFTWETAATTKGIAWIINNYAKLTLENMVIDGTNVAHNGNNVRNVVNNYSGTVDVKNSTITAVNGDYAINANFYNAFYTENSAYTAPITNITDSVINGKVEAVSGTINLNDKAKVNGQVRVGQNGKNGDKATPCATGAVVNIANGAEVSKEEYPVVVFGQNTLNVNGKVTSTSQTSNDTAAISTNGNKYNAGSVINVGEGAAITSNKCSAIYMPNGELNITGGEITGPTAVYFKSTKISISGGALTGNGTKADYTFNGNGGNPTGDALVIDNCNYPSGINQPVITGGQFKSVNAADVGSYAGNGQTNPLTKFITGGTFSKEPAANLIADGYKAVKSDNVWTVVEKIATAPTAATGLVYNGTEQTGVEGGEGYTVTTGTATNAGNYTATATLEAGYKWSDGTTAAKTITWSIEQATLTSATAASQTYTGTKLTPVVTAKAGDLNATFTVSDWSGNLTDVGTYTATVTGTGNFKGTQNVTFTIVAPTPGPTPGDQDPDIKKVEFSTSIDVSKDVEVKKDESGVVAAKTELSEKLAEELVKAATENKSAEVVIAATATTTETVDKAEVALPVKAIEELAKVDTVQTIVIQTNVAEVALDKEAAVAIAEQSPEGATIIVEAVREDEKSKEVAQDVYELKIIAVQSGTKTEIGDFKGGKVTVKVDIPEGLTGKKVACLYRDDNGKYTRRAITKQDDVNGFFSFTTEHFSDYVVTEESTAQKMLVNQTAENQKKLKAYANGKIKVSFDKVTYDTELGKKVQTYQIFRSTKKNSGFKKVGTVVNKKKSTKTITFTNAKKLKKGKKYYYKVRGRVQLANGKYAYTQWSNVRYAKCKKSR